MARSFRCLVFLAACTLNACGSSETIVDVENEPAPLFQGTVDDAVANSCSTGAVLGLSNQIVEQVNCLRPGTLAEIPARPNLTRGTNTFAFMQPPARDALVRALDANPSLTLGVNSMLRTVAQQYLLYAWYMAGRCSIMLAAAPGGSNHESGLALDTSQYTAWQSALEAEGFKWFGSSDVVHFDYTGPSTVDLRPIGVRGFQRLWNINHAADAIVEDGIYGPATESRLRQSPADGFAIPAPCSTPPDGGTVDARSDRAPDAIGEGGTGGSADAPVMDIPGARDATSSADAVDVGAGDATEPDVGSGDASSLPPGALDAGCSCDVAAQSRRSSSPTAWWAVGSLAIAGFVRRRRKARPAGAEDRASRAWKDAHLYAV